MDPPETDAPVYRIDDSDEDMPDVPALVKIEPAADGVGDGGAVPAPVPVPSGASVQGAAPPNVATSGQIAPAPPTSDAA
eukprot:10446288-Alexandrium_andersonii.AAC.1